MEKKLNVKEKYLMFIKRSKKNTDRQTLIATLITVLVSLLILI